VVLEPYTGFARVIISVLCRRAEEKKRSKEIVKSIELIEQTIPHSSIVWSYNDVESAYADIVALMKQHCGKLNFHDCLIALSAREHGIGRIISFDADFDDIEWLERIC
jgi:predicted nucleic acid-binding protein